MITRRAVLQAASLGAGALAAGERAAAQQRYARNLTAADMERWVKELSNWGRWGKEDQAGTVNLITPAVRKRAAGLVREGVSVSLSREAEVAAPGQQPARNAVWRHDMSSTGIGREEGYATDSITNSYHGYQTTHLDALSHYFWNGQIYNGFPASSITEWGATKNAITAFKDGILTRGVLLDMPALKGKAYLDDDEAIYPEDIEAWEKKAGFKVESGDAVMLRTGIWSRVAEKGPVNPNQKLPGLYASCAKWLKERDIAVVGSDAALDVRPSLVEGVNQPVHWLMLMAIGTPIMDVLYLEDVAKTAAQYRRWTFLVTAAPLRVPGATGSPWNPIATF